MGFQVRKSDPEKIVWIKVDGSKYFLEPNLYGQGGKLDDLHWKYSARPLLVRVTPPLHKLFTSPKQRFIYKLSKHSLSKQCGTWSLWSFEIPMQIHNNPPHISKVLKKIFEKFWKLFFWVHSMSVDASILVSFRLWTRSRSIGHNIQWVGEVNFYEPKHLVYVNRPWCA